MRVLPYPTISVLEADETPDPAVQRASQGANPVNSTPGWANRRTGPPEGLPALGYQARFTNPRINTVPWSTAQAQPRSEDKTMRPRAKKASNKRRRKSGYK